METTIKGHRDLLFAGGTCGHSFSSADSLLSVTWATVGHVQMSAEVVGRSWQELGGPLCCSGGQLS